MINRRKNKTSSSSTRAFARNKRSPRACCVHDSCAGTNFSSGCRGGKRPDSGCGGNSSSCRLYLQLDAPDASLSLSLPCAVFFFAFFLRTTLCMCVYVWALGIYSIERDEGLKEKRREREDESCGTDVLRGSHSGFEKESEGWPQHSLFCNPVCSVRLEWKRLRNALCSVLVVRLSNVGFFFYSFWIISNLYADKLI